MNRLPVRWQVTLAFAAALTVVLAGVGAFVYLRLAATLDEALMGSLLARKAEVSGLVSAPGGVLPPLSAPALEDDENIAQVLRPDGAVVAASSHAEVALLTADQVRTARSGTVVVDRPGDAVLDEALRVMAGPVTGSGQSLIVAVAVSLDEKTEALSALLALELIGLGSALLVSSAAGYLVAGLALRPVETLRRRAEQITADDLATTNGAALPVPPVDDELGRLAVTLNSMLERLRRAQATERALLARERRFVADASHQLRTPLAIIKSEVDVAMMNNASPSELRAALASTGEEADRLTALTDQLLVLAAADDRMPVTRQRIEVGTLLATVVERHRTRAAAAGRQIGVRAVAGLIITGDRVRLEQALDNLLDNALRHGGGDIEVTARHQDAQVLIAVRDHGRGFAYGRAEQTFERFRRGDGGGTGLGLAVVRAIAEAHGGQARAHNDAAGAEVVVTLPAGWRENAATPEPL